MNANPRLTYVRTVYGDRFRVSLDDLENPQRMTRHHLFRYNNRGHIISPKTPMDVTTIHRGNIVGPWAGCVHDLDEHNRRMDRIAAGQEA